MAQTRTTRRRRKPQPPTPPMPLVKRLAAAALFLGLGGVATALGLRELAGWIGSLGGGAAVIGTDNFVLGLPLLGVSMLAIGPEFLFPRLLARWCDERKEWYGKTVLGTMLVGLVLVLVGQIVINVVMAADGYRTCDVDGRGRYLDVTWARGDAGCPADGPGR